MMLVFLICKLGAGIEFGFWKIHTNAGFTQRVVNNSEGVYLTDQVVHFDLAFVF